MNSLTLFTWGYWGWGTATDQLISAVDAVEESRGYEPPFFVDIRISRSVRAPGFNGRAFEDTVGAARYHWLDDLGNLAVQQGGRMRIKDPSAAGTLLDIALGCARKRRRVLFFCSCEFPGIGDRICHRTAVARLLLDAARDRGVSTEVVEWPGGEPNPNGLEVQVTAEAFEKVRRGSGSIPLGTRPSLAELAALPWLSLVIVRRKGARSEPPLLFLSGPARYKKGGWYLPIHGDVDPEQSRQAIRQRIEELREEANFAARRVIC